MFISSTYTIQILILVQKSIPCCQNLTSMCLRFFAYTVFFADKLFANFNYKVVLISGRYLPIVIRLCEKKPKGRGKRMFAIVLNKSKTASLLQGDLAINTLLLISSTYNELETWKEITGRGYLESSKAKSKTEVGLP